MLDNDDEDELDHLSEVREERIAQIRRALDKTSSVQVLKDPKYIRSAKVYESSGFQRARLRTKHELFQASQYGTKMGQAYHQANHRRVKALKAALEHGHTIPNTPTLNTYVGPQESGVNELRPFQLLKGKRVYNNVVDPVMRHLNARGIRYHNTVPMVRDSLIFELEEDLTSRF